MAELDLLLQCSPFFINGIYMGMLIGVSAGAGGMLIYYAIKIFIMIGG